jgi:hypothetical protein
MKFNHREVRIEAMPKGEVLGDALLENAATPTIIRAMEGGCLVKIDLQSQQCTEFGMRIPDEALLPKSDLDSRGGFHISPSGRFGVLVGTESGHVFDTQTGRVTMLLDRLDYFTYRSSWSLAFFRTEDVHSGRVKELLIHPSGWNRLEISDPATGENLVQRGPTSFGNEHYNSYFHGGLLLAPGDCPQWVLDNGWVWQPAGVPTIFNLQTWLHENPWETEDGKSLWGVRRTLEYCSDVAAVWFNENLLGLWGDETDEADTILPALCIYNVATKDAVKLIEGVSFGRLYFDGEFLYVSEKRGKLSVWDIEAGKMILETECLPDFYDTAHQVFITAKKDRFILSTLEENRLYE